MAADALFLQPICGHPGEDRMQAHVSNLQPGHEWCTVLAQGDEAIWGAEHLLAALECCGVDNARIEIEGGQGESLAMYALEQQWHPHRLGGCADC